MKKKLFLYFIFFTISINSLYSSDEKNQDTKDSTIDSTIIINDIYVKGKTKYDKEFISKISGIGPGALIDSYGVTINNIIKKLWASKLFEDISVYKCNENKNKIDLVFEIKDLNEIHDIQLQSDGSIIKNNFSIIKDIKKGTPISESMIQEIKNEIKNYYQENGYNEVTIDSNIKQENNKNILFFSIKKGKKVKIEKFIFYGNYAISNKELLRIINGDQSFLSLLINKHNHFFIHNNINQYLEKIKEKYQSIGYRFAKVLLESVWKTKSGNYGIRIKIAEGKKYYLGNVKFMGNEKISKDFLKNILLHKNKNETIYNKVKLTESIFNTKTSSIINNYFKLGHLFINLIPIEKIRNNNKIDIKILIKENSPVYIRNIKILGNKITKDYIIKKEIKIYNKHIFSIDKLMESLHNIENLSLFDKVYFKIIPIDNKSIDIEWHVLEKNNNELKFYGGVIGNDIKKFTGGFKFILNNFSIKDIINWKYWHPIPQGEGEKITIHGQLGKYIKSVGFSFLKPWINKDNPTALNMDTNYSINRITNNESLFNNQYCLIDENNPLFLKKIGVSIGLNKNINLLDYNSNISSSINGERLIFPKETDYIKTCNNNNVYKINNLFYSLSLKRNTISPDTFFPTDGSNFKLDFSASPPYSWFEKKKFSKKDNIWSEHFQLKLLGNFYKKIKENLVLKCQGELGHSGIYNTSSGRKLTPFDIFYMGGTSKKLGENHIPLKGYDFPEENSFYEMSKDGGTNYKKISLEMNYLINGSNNNFKTYLNSFLEAGNIGNSYESLTSLEMNKSFGFGLRCICYPFGILELDISYPLNSIKNDFYKKWKLNFNIGNIHFI
ncbi:BamA/OMP85 family outer membrane protein [Blattabacterium cuenoti]|uniref:BamA/OMP85 family outer membrane protein n=1 Tax=Blattabacterium cuenoti TaxID=1653831 RepID=UPI00163CDA71|nr:POTRA domain-containing protein [Blattabacterium cuenoti]